MDGRNALCRVVGVVVAWLLLGLVPVASARPAERVVFVRFLLPALPPPPEQVELELHPVVVR